MRISGEEGSSVILQIGLCNLHPLNELKKELFSIVMIKLCQQLIERSLAIINYT